jgi:hypothetical protein
MATTQAIVQPNLFELQGYNTQITYSTTSIVGVPELTYSNRGQTLNFRGDEIQVEESQLGQMATVDISENPASEILEKLTLLIPIVRLKPESLEQVIQTTAIFSQLVRGTNAQLQTYMPLYLSGTAQQVLF